VRDISGLIALVRPGALDAASPDPSFNGNAADFYCAVAKGEKQPYYIHPDLEPIFGETNGICLYQEQLLRCFRDLAGYSYGEAEAVRRAVGKKVKELMDLHLGILKSRLLERGWSDSQATDLCETLVKSARYSFNKAHSASYAIVGYNGAWLKHHYPLHFWLGEFAVNTDKREKLRILMMEARHLVLPVNIKHSHVSEWTIEGDKLRPPLSLLKGCGEKTAISIKNAVLGIFGEGSGDIDIDEHEEYDHASDVEGEQYGDK
jgi:DNA polymerase-3 subunit alpha